MVKIGTVGIALEEISIGEWGSAYFKELDIRENVQAQEYIRKYRQIIVVDANNGAVEYPPEVKYLTKENVVKPTGEVNPLPMDVVTIWFPWNYYQSYSVGAGETQTVCTLEGAGEIIAVGLYVDGASTTAINSSVKVYMDDSEDPQFDSQLNWLQYLGGGIIPAYGGPIGGLQKKDDTNYIYSGYVNLHGGFRSKCVVKIVNGDPNNATTMKIYVLFRYKGTAETIEATYTTGTEGGGAPCFTGDTLITMADGSYKKAEDVKVGDLVKCYDFKKQMLLNTVITEVNHHTKEEMGDYYLIINNKLKVTPNHPLAKADGGRISAGQLRVGDTLWSEDGELKVDSIKKVREKVATYSFKTRSGSYFIDKILDYGKGVV